MQLPGHTSHRLQPLDVAVFGPLQTYYIQAQENFLRQYKGDRIYQTQIAALLKEAYGRAATVGSAESAFRASGIWPVNRNIFKDSDFASADALVPSVEMPVTLSTTMIGLREGVSTSAATQSNEIASTNTNSADRSTITASASPKSLTATGPASTSLTTQPSKTPELTDELKNVLHEISPLPKPNPQPEKLGKRKRKQELAQKAVVISSSPYKLHLAQSKVKTRSEKSTTKIRKTIVQEKQKNESKTVGESSWFCIICEENAEEEMIQCMACRLWVHTNCGRVSARVKKYFCPSCKS